LEGNKRQQNVVAILKRKLTSVVHVSVHRGAGLFPSLDKDRKKGIESK
jgi:hypothetical protein